MSSHHLLGLTLHAIVGGYIGIGDKDIAVPFSALRLEQHDNSRRIVIDAKKDELQAAPAFERP